MDGIESGSTGLLESSLRLRAGLEENDRPRVLAALAALESHLSRWSPDQVELEVSVKDRDDPDQKVTLQAWPAGWPRLVAVAQGRDLDHALIEARRELIRQIEDERSRRKPHKHRTTRHRAS
jgi:ribosome-associated translation inhibitor RaiA